MPAREERLRAVRQIVSNPHPYYINEAQFKHGFIPSEWIERVLSEPYVSDTQDDGRIRYWRPVPEVENWLRVIVDDGTTL